MQPATVLLPPPPSVGLLDILAVAPAVPEVLDAVLCALLLILPFCSATLHRTGTRPGCNPGVHILGHVLGISTHVHHSVRLLKQGP
jgi:hypothetical protein